MLVTVYHWVFSVRYLVIFFFFIIGVKCDKNVKNRRTENPDTNSIEMNM